MSIKIYNSFGQLITKFVDEQQSKGMHLVTWNAEGLPTGIYFYHLTANNQFSIGKMVLLK